MDQTQLIQYKHGPLLYYIRVRSKEPKWLPCPLAMQLDKVPDTLLHKQFLHYIIGQLETRNGAGAPHTSMQMRSVPPSVAAAGVAANEEERHAVLASRRRLHRPRPCISTHVLRGH
jgi:hypothetical protein